ncbi:hypothetical protein EDD91_0060 [Streptomyces sp. KS 21]|nr:hypothetical protein EDD91_0060 [Streptomyces sp. KS 21]
MPKIEFAAPPYDTVVNPHIDAGEACARHLAWAQGHGLVRQSDEAAEVYLGQQFVKCMMVLHPHVEDEAEFALLGDVSTWMATLDDQFDGPRGRDMPQARRIVDELLAATYLPPGAPVLRTTPGPAPGGTSTLAWPPACPRSGWPGRWRRGGTSSPCTTSRRPTAPPASSRHSTC